MREADASPGRRVVRQVEAGAGEPAVVLEAGLNNGMPLPARWGWRIVNAIFPDELHGDAPVTLAALRELHAAARPFPDVPVVVLSAARGFPRRFRAHWTRLQAGRAAAAARGHHVVVDGTGHNIPRDRPDVVADTILAVAATARAGTG